MADLRSVWWKREGFDSALGHAFETAALLADGDERRAPGAPDSLYLDRAHRAFAEERIDLVDMEERVELALRGGWVPR